MNTAAKGARTERKSRDLLEAEGYRVTRAAASLGAWDLVALNAEEVLLVQVKANRWPGSEEMAELRSFPAPPEARRVVHRWKDYAREPDIRELENDTVEAP